MPDDRGIGFLELLELGLDLCIQEPASGDLNIREDNPPKRAPGPKYREKYSAQFYWDGEIRSTL